MGEGRGSTSARIKKHTHSTRQARGRGKFIVIPARYAISALNTFHSMLLRWWSYSAIQNHVGLGNLFFVQHHGPNVHTRSTLTPPIFFSRSLEPVTKWSVRLHNTQFRQLGCGMQVKALALGIKSLGKRLIPLNQMKTGSSLNNGRYLTRPKIE